MKKKLGNKTLDTNRRRVMLRVVNGQVLLGLFLSYIYSLTSPLYVFILLHGYIATMSMFEIFFHTSFTKLPKYY